MTAPTKQWETRPGLGRYGVIMLAPQAAVGQPAAAPTLVLHATAFMPPLERLIKTKDNGANGSIRNRRSRVQGVQADGRQISVEMTLGALAALCGSIGPSSAGTIVPSGNNFDVLAPGIPWTVWQLHPTGDRIAQDVQIGAIGLTMGGRQTVTASITLNTTTTQPLTGLPPVGALPGDMLQFKHWWLKVNDVLYKPEQGALTLTIPMAVVDGADGTHANAANYPQGWERSDSTTLGVDFTLPALVTPLRDAYEQNGLVKVETGFTLPATGGGTEQTISFLIKTAEVDSVDVPTGMDRIQVPYKTIGVSEDTLAEFNIKVPA